MHFEHRLNIEEYIQTEKKISKACNDFEEEGVGKKPKGSNVMGSHQFCGVSTDDKMKLKCHLTTIGTQDKKKENIHKDSSTAQFPIICIILSLHNILQFSFVNLVVKSAYLRKILNQSQRLHATAKRVN